MYMTAHRSDSARVTGRSVKQDIVASHRWGSHTISTGPTKGINLPVKGFPPSNGLSAAIIILMAILAAFLIIILASAIVQSRRKIRKRQVDKDMRVGHLAARQMIQHAAADSGMGSERRYLRLGSPPPAMHNDGYKHMAKRAVSDIKKPPLRVDTHQRASSIKRDRKDSPVSLEPESAAKSKRRQSPSIAPRKSKLAGARKRKDPRASDSLHRNHAVDPVEEERYTDTMSTIARDPLNACILPGQERKLKASIRAVVHRAPSTVGSKRLALPTSPTPDVPLSLQRSSLRKTRSSYSAPMTKKELCRVDSFSWREASLPRCRSPQPLYRYRSLSSSLTDIEPLRTADVNTWLPDSSLASLTRNSSWYSDARQTPRTPHGFI